MPPKKDDRARIPPLGEYYDDLLTVDAWIAGKSKASQANNLLCSKLQEREQLIRDRIKYLAQKQGIPAEELWMQILKKEIFILNKTKS